MYEYIPQKNLKKTTGIVLLLGAAAAVAVFFTSLFPEMPFRWALQLMAIGCLAAIVYITARYVTKSFIYRIEKRDEDGGLDLTVTELTGGKKPVTVCRIGLESISAVSRVTEENRESLKKKAGDSGRKKFIYICDIKPPVTLWLFAEECGEPLSIKISANEEFASLIERNAGKGIEQ